MTNYIVTIGRNIGDEPMDEARWDNFSSEVIIAAGEWDFTLITEAYGYGHWQGTVEDSAVFVFSGDDAKAWRVLNTLTHIAYKYEQEAIAWQEVKAVSFVRP